MEWEGSPRIYQPFFGRYTLRVTIRLILPGNGIPPRSQGCFIRIADIQVLIPRKIRYSEVTVGFQGNFTLYAVHEEVVRRDDANDLPGLPCASCYGGHQE